MSVPEVIQRPITVDVAYTDADLWQSCFRYYFRFETLLIFVAASTVYGLVLAFLFLKGNALLLHIGEILITSCLLTVVFTLLMCALGVANTKRTGNVRVRFVFSPDDLRITSDFFESTIKWTYLAGSGENANYFFLSTRRSERYLVPKRCISTEEDRNLIRKLLRSFDNRTGSTT
jgi:hypothetical protein